MKLLQRNVNRFLNNFFTIVPNMGLKKLYFVGIIRVFFMLAYLPVSCAYKLLVVQLMSRYCNCSGSHPETAVFTPRKEITLMVLYSSVWCHTQTHYIKYIYIAQESIGRVDWHETRERSGRLSDQLIVVGSTSKQAYHARYIIVINNERIFVQ